jgi:ParB family chromosome partitioning protein
VTDVAIRAEQIEIWPIEKVVPNPKNRNKHPEDQIEDLMRVIRYQGFRQPLIISRADGLLVAGHGRLEAAKRLGMTRVPVMYQEFLSPEQQYAAGVSDNGLARRSEIDFAGINLDLPELGPDFDLSALGLKDFNIDPPNFDPGTEDDQGKLDEKKPVECPACGHSFTT